MAKGLPSTKDDRASPLRRRWRTRRVSRNTPPAEKTPNHETVAENATAQNTPASGRYAGFTEGSVARHLIHLGSFMALGSLSMIGARIAGSLLPRHPGHTSPGGDGVRVSDHHVSVRVRRRDRHRRFFRNRPSVRCRGSQAGGASGHPRPTVGFPSERGDQRHRVRVRSGSAGVARRPGRGSRHGDRIPPHLHAGLPAVHAVDGRLHAAARHRQRHQSGHRDGRGIVAADRHWSVVDLRPVRISGTGLLPVPLGPTWRLGCSASRCISSSWCGCG